MTRHCSYTRSLSVETSRADGHAEFAAAAGRLPDHRPPVIVHPSSLVRKLLSTTGVDEVLPVERALSGSLT